MWTMTLKGCRKIISIAITKVKTSKYGGYLQMCTFFSTILLIETSETMQEFRRIGTLYAHPNMFLLNPIPSVHNCGTVINIQRFGLLHMSNVLDNTASPKACRRRRRKGGMVTLWPASSPPPRGTFKEKLRTNLDILRTPTFEFVLMSLRVFLKGAFRRWRGYTKGWLGGEHCYMSEQLKDAL
jgi:hypothetical protein